MGITGEQAGAKAGRDSSRGILSTGLKRAAKELASSWCRRGKGGGWRGVTGRSSTDEIGNCAPERTVKSKRMRKGKAPRWIMLYSEAMVKRRS